MTQGFAPFKGLRGLMGYLNRVARSQGWEELFCVRGMRGSPLRKVNLLVGIFAIGIGGSIILVPLDIIRTPDSSFHAPRWIAGMAGGVFVLAGLSVLFRELSGLLSWSEDLSGLMRTVRKIVVILIVASMAGIANWVAFGPGERSYSGSAGGASLTVFFQRR